VGSQSTTLVWRSVAGRTKRFFFAGDTGYSDLFPEIGSRLGPFDRTAIPIGGYWPPTIMKAAHTTPEEALQIFMDVRGSYFLGIHWGTFDLTEEPVQEPLQRLEAESRRRGLDSSTVWLLKHGESRSW
jgi:N-acyl-phosphatidylethanolamine-hydrolysing phospholipase D